MYKFFFLACLLLINTPIAFATNTLMPNVTAPMQTAAFWYTNAGEKIVANSERIKTMNQSMLSDTMCDLATFPDGLSSDTLREYLSHYQIDRNLYLQGQLLSSTYTENLLADTQGTILPNNKVAYGLVVSRSNLRSFPTLDGAFGTSDGETFDQWQETAVDPGQPAIILHYNSKGDFAFVQLASYRGWLPTNRLALTTKANWLTYVAPLEFAVVTNKTLTINHELYQMGARLPLVKGNLLIPTRSTQGYLISVTIPANFSADLHKGYLPFTRNNLLQMAFKHLGAPYGWGGLFNSVDCSSFVQDVYNTVGVHLPRNGDEQAEAFVGSSLENLSWEERVNTIKSLPPGSLIFSPYHVMLYLGEYNGRPYMIHSIGSYGAQDTAGNIYKNSVMNVIVSDIYLLGGSGNALLLQMTKATNYQ